MNFNLRTTISCKFCSRCPDGNNVTPEVNLQIQYTVVNLHGPKRLETLKTLEGNPEITKHEPVRRAVNYIAYYGDDGAKQLALEIAAKMKVLSPDAIDSLKT